MILNLVILLDLDVLFLFLLYSKVTNFSRVRMFLLNAKDTDGTACVYDFLFIKKKKKKKKKHHNLYYYAFERYK